jgi:putative effector of murein hydrolase
MYGSSLADIIAMILRVIVAVIIAKKYNAVGFRLTTFAKIVLIVIVLSGAGLYLSYTQYMYSVSLLNILLKLLVVAVYIGIVAYANRQTLKRYWNGWKAKRA